MAWNAYLVVVVARWVLLEALVVGVIDGFGPFVRFGLNAAASVLFP